MNCFYVPVSFCQVDWLHVHPFTSKRRKGRAWYRGYIEYGVPQLLERRTRQRPAHGGESPESQRLLIIPRPAIALLDRADLINSDK